VDEGHGSHDEAHAAEGDHVEQHHQDAPPAAHDEAHAEAADERQPDSNASAPQNFAPHYNPTQNYPSRGGSERPGQNYGRGNDRGGDRGRGGQWGRRGEEDALAEDARKAARAADAISRPQNTLRRRAVNLAATTIAEASHAVTTTGVKTPRAVPVLLLR